MKQLEKCDGEDRFDRLVERNVIEQVYNIGKINVVRNAWQKNDLSDLHGWV